MLYEGFVYFVGFLFFSIKMGFECVVVVFGKFGDLQFCFFVFYVVGINGKGLICVIVVVCLCQCYKMGLYMLLYFEWFNECIQIDGVEIDDEIFGCCIVEVVDVFGVDYELMYFEFGIVVVFWYFVQEVVDIVVVEMGLGGWFDVMIVCCVEVICVILVDFDYMEYFGMLFVQIVGEKVGIFKLGVFIVLVVQWFEVLKVLDWFGVKLEGCDFFDVLVDGLKLCGVY